MQGLLTRAKWYRADPEDPGYGLTPLHVAPIPDSTWRGLFDDTLIDRHLDRLASDQQADGGWSITWEPPGAASMLWNGAESRLSAPCASCAPTAGCEDTLTLTATPHLPS